MPRVTLNYYLKGIWNMHILMASVANVWNPLHGHSVPVPYSIVGKVMRFSKLSIPFFAFKFPTWGHRIKNLSGFIKMVRVFVNWRKLLHNKLFCESFYYPSIYYTFGFFPYTISPFSPAALFPPCPILLELLSLFCNRPNWRPLVPPSSVLSGSFWWPLQK